MYQELDYRTTRWECCRLVMRTFNPTLQPPVKGGAQSKAAKMGPGTRRLPYYARRRHATAS